MPVSDFSSKEFRERLRKRDQAAVEELVVTYFPQLFRAGRGMGFSREESEDLAQSAFTVLIKTLPRFESRSHIRTFLFGIFFNKVREYLRAKEREKNTDSIDESMESRFDRYGKWQQPFVETEIFAEQVQEIIRECLDALPPAQRAAFYLREVEEMKMSEICKRIDVSLTNCGVLLFRARNRLRECVEKKGVKRS
jgi:RNA polymerase sigma-70 factor, ECF subfamily